MDVCGSLYPIRFSADSIASRHLGPDRRCVAHIIETGSILFFYEVNCAVFDALVSYFHGVVIPYFPQVSC